MLIKLFKLSIISVMTISSAFLSAIECEIQDIGTLQTRSSRAVDLNNQGQILGWYNIDDSRPAPASSSGKHYFVRDRDGSFHELPIHNGGGAIDWRYLVDGGKAYGVHDYGSGLRLYMWDQNNGVVKLGDLPGREISAINQLGQVLIKSYVTTENGKSIVGPAIWENGKITRLKGAESNLGLPSEEAYGLDMNNKGEVVGQSIVDVNYKNTIYKQVHATKWVNGQAIDLHYSLPKSEKTIALAINDNGDVLFNINNYPILLYKDGSCNTLIAWPKKITNSGGSCSDYFIFTKDKPVTVIDTFTHNVQADAGSIWSSVTKIIKLNDKGEAIAYGKTIYGEDHAILLIPVNAE